MKRLLIPFLFLLACLFSGSAVAQTYFPLPDSNAVWSVDYDKYLVRGDSAVQSILYKKYYFTKDSLLSPSSLQFKGLIRQDSLHKRIFGIKKGQNIERLLYDFNLNVSDTLTVFSFDFYSQLPLIVKVQAIDSFLVNGTYRKRYKLIGYHFTGQPEYWMEGIGSIFGPLNPGLADYGVVDYCPPGLLCLYQNNVQLYNNPLFNSCYHYTCSVGIEEQKKKPDVIFFPNPGNGLFTLHTENIASAQLEIINCLGERIIQRHIENNNSLVDLSREAKGIYFYRLISGNKVLAQGKLIVN
jgi:hypothetical protein